MVLIAMIVMLGFAVLYCLSRREEGKPLERMAVYLYKKGCIHKLPFLNAHAVQKDLENLHPGQSGLLLQGEYYQRKIRMVLLVVGVGTLLGLLVWGKGAMGGALTAQGELRRPNLGQGEQQVQLQAWLENEGTGNFTVLVPERRLTRQEAQELLEEFWEELKREALGDNPSWQAVERSLTLVEELEGYPFTVVWHSSDYERIGTGGTVYNPEEPVTVTLTAEIGYLDYLWQKELEVLVCPRYLEGAELLLAQAREAYDLAEREAAARDHISLPSSLGGRQLFWKEVREDYSPVLMLMTICTAASVFFLQDRDLHRQVIGRREKMKGAYPVVLNKLTLYLGAGMTIRGAFRKVALDYYESSGFHSRDGHPAASCRDYGPVHRKRRNGESEQPLYEEMLYACNQLQAGIPESRAYEMWAARTGLQDCARLSAMLVQNLKKGNAALLLRLREEGDKALQEDLNLRRKKGEEAGTGLLVPMIMMMAIVMVLVMVPAFQSFGV